jgi:uncharacterized protein YbaR (Trm112 family)
MLAPVVPTMIDPTFLRMLVCPGTKQPLRMATADELAKVNRAVAAGTAKNRGGALVVTPVSEGLVTVDGAALYPVLDGIPILLSAEAVMLPPAAG